jgi:hypothetical protein
MQATRREDREFEFLLTRTGNVSDDFADLAAFVSVMSSDHEPPRDVSHMATSLAAAARATGHTTSRGLKRLVTVGLVGALLMAMSGIALAANNATPGHALYGVDKALEAIGVGDGGVEERLAEFDFLVANGSDEQAFVFLAEYIDSANDREAVKAQSHLELAATKSNPNAQAAQEKVAALAEFIEANKGKGVGVDGRDFGQGVSGIARSENESESPQATSPPAGEEETESSEQRGLGEDKVPGPPEHAGPKSERSPEGGQSEDASTSQGAVPEQPTTEETPAKSDAKEPGPPDHAGPKDDKEPGPPDHAGKDK